MYIGQVKPTKIRIHNKMMVAKVKWNGSLYLVEVPSISRQYIGIGKTITSAKDDASKTIKNIIGEKCHTYKNTQHQSPKSNS